jgi:hypothetical protein
VRNKILTGEPLLAAVRLFAEVVSPDQEVMVQPGVQNRPLRRNSNWSFRRLVPAGDDVIQGYRGHPYSIASGAGDGIGP